MKYLFYLILTLIPLRDVLLIEISGVSIRLSEVVLVVFDIIFLITFIFGKVKINFKPLFFFGFYFFMLGTAVFSLILPGTDKSLIFREIININFYLVSFISITMYVVNEKLNMINVFKYLIFVNVAFGIFVLINYYSEWFFKIRDYEILFGFITRRLEGLASEPAYWVNLLFLPLILLICFSLNNRRFIKFQITGVVVILLNYAFTFSTFAILTIIITIAMFYLLYKTDDLKQYSFRFFILIFILLALILSIQMVGPLVEKVINSDTNSSSQERYFWRASAIEMFQQRPFFGYGVGSYASHHAKLYPEIRSANDANSVFFLYLAERGAFGIIVLIAFFGMIIINLLKTRRIVRDKTEKTVSTALLITLMMFLIHFFAIGYIWIYYFWIYLGLIVSYDMLQRKGDYVL